MRKKPPSKSFSSLIVSVFLSSLLGKELGIVGEAEDSKAECNDELGKFFVGDGCLLFASAISFRFAAIISRI